MNAIEQKSEERAALKGVKQAKIIRAMLRLSTFTRKNLAEESAEDIQSVNGVLARKGQYLRVVERRNAGRRGAPEEVLALTSEGEEKFLEELSPLYGDLQAEWDADITLSTYEPAALEYRVAQEIIAKFELPPGAGKTYAITRPDVERALRLLGVAEESEEIPTEGRIGERRLGSENSLNDRQQVANARIDFLKGKLSWFALISQDMSLNDLFAADPFQSGLAYFNNAAQVLKQYKAADAVEGIDYWSMKQVWSALLAFLRSESSLQKPLKSVLDVVDAAVLPGLRAQLASVVQPDAGKMAEGLVNLYDELYQPSPQKVVGLVDIRPGIMTFAVVEGKVPVLMRRAEFELQPNRSLVGSFQERVKEVKTGLEFYQCSTGKKVEEVFVAGDLRCAEGFVKLEKELESSMKIFAGPGTGKTMAFMAMYAAETGLALKARSYQVESHRSAGSRSAE